ncbi:MAG: hypothetical protein ACTHJ4_08715 [Candidatus Nucleicultricaceae bacterium]
MASANTTLLARMMLNTTFIEARLVTADMLEVTPCVDIPANDFIGMSTRSALFNFLTPSVEWLEHFTAVYVILQHRFSVQKPT